MNFPLTICVGSSWPFTSCECYDFLFYLLRKLLIRIGQSWFKHQSYLESLPRPQLFNYIFILFYSSMKRRPSIIREHFLHFVLLWCTCNKVSPWKSPDVRGLPYQWVNYNSVINHVFTFFFYSLYMNVLSFKKYTALGTIMTYHSKFILSLYNMTFFGDLIINSLKGGHTAVKIFPLGHYEVN